MNPPRRGTPDFLLLLLTFVLVCFGLVMVFSASSMTSAYRWGDPWYFTKKANIRCWRRNDWHVILHECPLHEAKEARHPCFLLHCDRA